MMLFTFCIYPLLIIVLQEHVICLQDCRKIELIFIPKEAEEKAVTIFILDIKLQSNLPYLDLKYLGNTCCNYSNKTYSFGN